MSHPPKTILHASAAEAEAIRRAVREADVAELGPNRVRAGPEHVPSLVRLLSDPAVSDPLYDLPRPLTEANVAAWVAAALARAAAGEGLLIVTLDEAGEAAGYSMISVWPERTSAELAGAMRADLQGRGQGGGGAAHTFGWIFERLGVRLMCLTAALDNVRSAKLIEAAGFRRMGERDAVRPDGTTRRSLYWEMTADEWRRRHRL